MARFKIVLFPDPLLKQKSAPLTDFGPKVQELLDAMIETMYGDDGVGLAASQIGVLKRILIASPTMKPGEEWVIINPEIYEARGRIMGSEGCLSFPGINVEVARAKSIRFRYQDRTGEAHDTEASDFFARIVQHEMDHLDGILLTDRVDFEQRHHILAQFQHV